MIIEKINNEVWATLRPSKYGVGVFAIRDIPKGTSLSDHELDVQRYYEVSEEEFNQLLEPIRNMILDRTQQLEGQPIRFRHPNCHARLETFMNHSSKPNSDGKIALIDIKKNREITKNYFDKPNLHKLTIKHFMKLCLG